MQALLNNIYFGPVRAAQRNDIGVARQADFGCPAGQRRVVTPIGAVECEREVPATCAIGEYRIDSLGLADRCARSVRDGSCRPFEECEPIEQLVNADMRVGNRAATQRPRRVPGQVAGAARRAERRTAAAARRLPRHGARPRPGDARAWFSLPHLDQVMDWVIGAGNDAHRAREFWDGWIRRSCLPRNGLRYQYCHPQESSSFIDETNRLVGAPLP